MYKCVCKNKSIKDIGGNVMYRWSCDYDINVYIDDGVR